MRALLEYLDRLHRNAGQPSLSEMGRAVALAPSTLSAFFRGTRLISRGNLELIVEHLGGDTQRAERLRRRAAPAWNATRDDAAPSSTLESIAEVDPEGPDTALDRLDLIVFDKPANTVNRPARLFGRKGLIEELMPRLGSGERILLHGLAGSGKTALAATLADAWVDAGRGPYLWLRTTSPDEELVFDAILRHLATAKLRARVGGLAGAARLLAIQEVLHDSGVSLCVLDDVWHPALLHALVKALPTGLPLVVTSRLKLGLDGVVEVGGLPPAEAAPLLALHAKDDGYAWHPDADELCRLLGHHPYAIEIAGSHLRQYSMSPAELRDAIAASPHSLSMPGGFAERGRESLTSLLDRTYAALESPDTRLALAAFGAFYSGTATVHLIAAYLGFDLPRTHLALNGLVDLSLARRLHDKSYEIHDLTYSYARTLHAGPPDDHHRAIHAVLEFVKANIRDYEILSLDFANILGAAARAREADADAFIAIVESIATGGYLDDRGHTLGLLRLLDEAITAVRARDGESGERLHLLLSKRGNAAYNQGDHAVALASYRAALAISPHQGRRVVLLAVIGRVLAELGDYPEADRHFTEAYLIADAQGDDDGLLRIVEQRSIAAFRQRSFAEARELAQRGVELSRLRGLRGLEAIFINNLGSAEFELGVDASLGRHHEAHAIAAELHDDDVLALTHRTLGIDYHAKENYESARHHLSQALHLYRTLGQTEREAGLRKMMQRFGYL